MCDVSMALAGVGAVGSLAGTRAGRRQASAQNRVNAVNHANDMRYREEARLYGERIYAQDLAFNNEMLQWQKEQFGLTQQFVEDTKGAIQEDYLQQLSTLMLRGVEEATASLFFAQDITREGNIEGGSVAVSAGARNVSGNSVDAIFNQVSFDRDRDLSILEANTAAVNRQLILESKGLKARRDTELGSIPIQVFNPMQIAAPPSPIGNPARPTQVSGPSWFSAIGQVGGHLAQGVQSHYANRGQYMPSSFRDTILLKPGPART